LKPLEPWQCHGTNRQLSTCCSRNVPGKPCIVNIILQQIRRHFYLQSGKIGFILGIQNPITMNTYEKTPTTTFQVVSLQHLVNELLNCYGRVKKNHRQYFINDIPGHIIIRRDQIAPLLGDLFSIISTHPGCSPVRITAMATGRHIKLYVKEDPFPRFCFPGSIAA